jgi:hypothetical protein
MFRTISMVLTFENLNFSNFKDIVILILFTESSSQKKKINSKNEILEIEFRNRN